MLCPPTNQGVGSSNLSGRAPLTISIILVKNSERLLSSESGHWAKSRRSSFCKPSVIKATLFCTKLLIRE